MNGLRPLHPDLPADRPQMGVDEAGRGSFWGPLIAAAVILPDLGALETGHPLRENVTLIKDSKKLTEKRRQKIYDILITHATAIGVGRVEAIEIDQKNAFWANSLAFRRAVDACVVDYVARGGAPAHITSYSVVLDGPFAVAGFSPP